MTITANPPLTPGQRDRARSLGDLIDRVVAGQDGALGLIGTAIDAFATSLRTQPDQTYSDLAPWLTLAGECMTFIETGVEGAALARFTAGDLTLPGA